jgi:thioredoxin reductase (NADPH)
LYFYNHFNKEQAMEVLDVVIVGAGPIGLACAIEAKKSGLKYLVIEKGCLVNSLYNYPLNMTFFSTSERLEIGNVPFTSLSTKPNRQEAIEYYRRVAQLFQLDIHLFEKVIGVEKNDKIFIITTKKENYQTANIIISTGFYDIPNLLNVPGEDFPKVTHYYKDPHFYSFQNVLVVGGNNSAVDAALETFRKGANVTMLMQGNNIGEKVKYWVRPDVINRIEEGSIKAYYNSHIKAIRELEVDLETPTGIVTIKNDFVLAMTGYQPDFSFLEKFGIELDNSNAQCPAYNDHTMETNIKGIYLAGVVCGGMNTHKWFIENSREHANKIVKAINKEKK